MAYKLLGQECSSRSVAEDLIDPFGPEGGQSAVLRSPEDVLILPRSSDLRRLSIAPFETLSSYRGASLHLRLHERLREVDAVVGISAMLRTIMGRTGNPFFLYLLDSTSFSGSIRRHPNPIVMVDPEKQRFQRNRTERYKVISPSDRVCGGRTMQS